LEIGPGLGPLTELLLANAGEVLAIEKDKRLVDFLQTKFSGAKNLRLLHGDALELLKRESRDWSGWKLVANLPYSVASPILVELAEAKGGPEKIVTTLQIEVAQRIAAKAGEDDYGILSLLLQLQYEPQGWFKIPAACFFPEPDVDSACIVLNRRVVPLLSSDESEIFKKIVKRAFSQRRKMMLKLLKQDWPKEKLESAFAELNISPQERAEKVSLEQFVNLTKLLAANE
jgi:16S rRNA (adenine1518-N6/adenine1519-N6)-dimethyltransferase